MTIVTPLKVLYVTWAYPKLSETFVRKEIELMRSRGHQVVVFAVRGRGHGVDEHCHYLQLRPLRLLRAVWCVLKTRAPRLANGCFEDAACRLVAHLGAQQVSPWSPEIIHAHFLDRPSTVALHWGRAYGVPVTAIAHARDWNVHVTPRSLRAKGTVAAHFFAISHHALRGLREKGDIPEEKLSLCRAHFSTQALPDGPRRSDDQVVTVARLVPKKGLDVLIDAMSILVSSQPNARLTIIGEGPERRRLQDRVRQRGLDRQVSFAGSMENRDVIHMLMYSTAFALPCRVTKDGDADGIPVALMEAGNMGVPVVTTPVAGIPELIENGVTGILVSPDSPEALAEALSRLLEDAGLRRALVRGMQRRLALEFAPELQAARLESVWESLTSA